MVSQVHSKPEDACLLWLMHARSLTRRRRPNEEIKERIRQTIPVGRFATAQEISTHALYLLSPACTYLNGEVLTADGGGWLGPMAVAPAEDMEARRQLRKAAKSID